MDPRHLYRASAALVFSVGLPLLGCSVATKQKVMEPALHDTERRLETFEATLRIFGSEQKPKEGGDDNHENRDDHDGD